MTRFALIVLRILGNLLLVGFFLAGAFQVFYGYMPHGSYVVAVVQVALSIALVISLTAIAVRPAAWPAAVAVCASAGMLVMLIAADFAQYSQLPSSQWRLVIPFSPFGVAVLALNYVYVRNGLRSRSNK